MLMTTEFPEVKTAVTFTLANAVIHELAVSTLPPMRREAFD